MKYLKYILFFLFIGILIFLGFYLDGTSEKEYYFKSQELQEKGDYQAAIDLQTKGLKLYKNSRILLINRGVNKSLLGDDLGAIKDYEKILRFDADNTMALTNIGMRYNNLNMAEQAITYFTKALNTDGVQVSGLHITRNMWNNVLDEDIDYMINESDIEQYRGINYFKIKEFKLAILDLENSKPYFTDYKAYQSLGYSYYHLKDTIKALEILTELAKENDSLAMVYLKNLQRTN